MNKLNSVQLQATKAECFLDSLEGLNIYSKMVRTEGVDQLSHWYTDEPVDADWITEREYWCGVYKNRPYFAKRIISLPKTHTMPEFIAHNIENLILLEDLSYVPNLLFWTEDTIGMEFCTGKNIKQLWYEGEWNLVNAEVTLPFIVFMLADIRNRLLEHERFFDLSWNNIIIDGNDAKIVDFDPCDRYVSIVDMTEMLIRLARRTLGFNQKGELVDL